MNKFFLSIIIPAHNEENRLPRTLEEIFSFLKGQSYPSEVIVVENGSTDETLSIANDFAKEHPGLVVIHEDRNGKGNAVRRGMLEARGEYRFICDADLSMPIEDLPHFLPPDIIDFDIAIGSREAPGSIRYNEPPYRHIGGRAINLAIRSLILPGLNDTQCGFKCFRASATEDLFRLQTLTGWSFDIELLYLARRKKLRIREIPIRWYFDPDSKVSAVRDALRMIGDIFRIHLNALRGAYESKP
ncbi:MAG: glycosyltransferase family 2 protein [Anaerolineales bacterium]|nr:MAG: glycosyltransferase family 2 protein [Chloroflexota bacterium]MBE7432784.1 glycosyltransferase family 2 protein [Anaerolineales bacterium]MCE7860482.1 glycosyltransferase family 2 protein [Chloroflexi bacterium CFX2]MCK6582699.1 glycosyltransferase family 2 protein [Anaerolineales bacterium]GJQ36548.1 MAG: glycosyl transferase [Anaerolineaceae bacterium]